MHRGLYIWLSVNISILHMWQKHILQTHISVLEFESCKSQSRLQFFFRMQLNMILLYWLGQLSSVSSVLGPLLNHWLATSTSLHQHPNVWVWPCDVDGSLEMPLYQGRSYRLHVCMQDKHVEFNLFNSRSTRNHACPKRRLRFTSCFL